MNDDTISRREAIEAFQPYNEYESNRSNKDWVRRIELVLGDLPSAESERKTGKWVKPTGMMPPEYHGDYWCSECQGWALKNRWHKMVLSDYCPNCGARMVKTK